MTAKEKLIKLIEEFPDHEVTKVLDFAEFLKAKYEEQLVNDLTKASESSLDFWENEKDDEVWNNV